LIWPALPLKYKRNLNSFLANFSTSYGQTLMPKIIKKAEPLSTQSKAQSSQSKSAENE
jgi:hypothetical protein